MPKDDRCGELSPLSPDDDDEKDDIGIGVAHGRPSFSYYRLPEPLLKLPVLKLDGSSFDVQVASSASVQELKLAVENVFSRPPKEDGVQISWPHVWSQFCLCYEGIKLIDDRASLRSLRIKDGEQLRFVRHLSINCSPTKRQPRNHGTILEKNRRTLTAPEDLEKIEENGMNESDRKVGPSQYADEKCHNYEENEAIVGQKEFRLSRFLLRWLSCIRLQSSGRTRLEGRAHSSTSGSNC